jgi:hypothetical protein
VRSSGFGAGIAAAPLESGRPSLPASMPFAVSARHADRKAASEAHTPIAGCDRVVDTNARHRPSLIPASTRPARASLVLDAERAAPNVVKC